MLALAIAAAGGLGAGLRWAADVALWRWRAGGFPWPIFLVNVCGSLALAFLAGAAGRLIAPDALAIVGTGLLGGLTTFSTVSVDAAQMWRQRRYRAALGNALGTLAACGLAGAVGFAAGAALLWARTGG
ncbi:CrcB family protein [Microbacterium excoecariae]|uniref:CrcB family protein n=1 Tax=Microbacterium excoecariae TaxID=2715210 RepID=UPI0014094161|nr:CrcB family protein [Microbacterium excoecariae]NHI16190.1 hypothetical protein [Microbacterium excoecariae]